MNPHASSPLSPELIGIWSSRVQSIYERNLQHIFRASTGLILLIILIETINQIGLVPVAAFLISGVIILTLEFYAAKIPYITIPISQGVIFIGAVYIHFYNLFSQQSGFLDSPYFPLLPDLLGFVLGIVISIRIVIGMELIKLERQYQYARVPLSGHSREALEAFETNLQLVSTEVKREFLEEFPKYRIKHLFSHFIFSFSLLLFLLIPLWLNIVLDVIIYPYILLIPGVLGLLIMILFFSPKAKNSQ